MKNKKKPAVKPAVSLLAAVTALAFLLAACNNEVPVTHDLDGGNDAVQVTSTYLNLDNLGISAPVNGESPSELNDLSNMPYTGSLVWKDLSGNSVSGSFAGGTVYQAFLTLDVRKGYTFKGLTASNFTLPSGLDSGNINPPTITKKRASFTLTYEATPPDTRDIDLNPPSHNFPVSIAGSLSSVSVLVSVYNTGSVDAGQLAVSSDNSNFTVSPTSITVTQSNPDSFTVSLSSTLAPGSHTATITVSNGSDIDENFNVSIIVLPSTTSSSVATALTNVRADSAGSSVLNPVSVPLNNITNDDVIIFLNNVAQFSKYVDLNISGTFTGGDFNPSGASAGKDKVTGITLPASCNIAAGTASNPTFNGFGNLATVNASTTGVTYTVGDNAFTGLTSLQTVTLPRAQTIGDSAFKDCTSLTAVDFGVDATGTGVLVTIGANAFENCDNSGFTEITLPSSIDYIGDEAFKGCTNLTTVNCWATTEPTTIGTDAFNGTSLTNVNVPSGSESNYAPANWGTGVSTIGTLP